MGAAWAHAALAISINNSGGDRELMNRSYAAAWRHRERLTERERLIIEAHYYKNTGKAIVGVLFVVAAVALGVAGGRARKASNAATTHPPPM